MGTVRLITEGMYATPDPALAEEIARHPVDVFPDIRKPGEGYEASVTAAELAAEYAALVAYTASQEGEVTYGTAYLIRADGEVASYRDLAAIESGDYPRALLTAALQARALRNAADRAAQQFAALLWTARGVADLNVGDGT